MLKLSLPGVDPAAIPMLTAEQVAQIPAEFLDFLHERSRVEDYGDIKIISLEDDAHNFTIMSIAGWVSKGRLEHDELEVLPLEQGPDHAPVVYDPRIHEQDVTFVSTLETHALFLQRLGLYMFSLSADMEDFQAYLCETICKEYPIYEAELIAILTTVFEHTDDLRGLDSNLASFVSERMFCLRKILANNTAVLPLLCKAISTKDHFLALTSRANHPALLLALAELQKDVGQVSETDALLGTFIEQNRALKDEVQPIQPLPLVTPSTQGKPRRGRPSRAATEVKRARLENSVAPSTTPSNAGGVPHDVSATRLASPKSVETSAAIEAFLGGLGPNSSHPSVQIDVDGRSSFSDSVQSVPKNAADDEIVYVGPSDTGRTRRRHPGKSLWEKKPSSSNGLGGREAIRLSRPKVDNEYWSVTREEWYALSEIQQRSVTHAGNICETEAGMVAPTPCDACYELGHLCEIYTDNKRHRLLGKSCARCRLTVSRCSLAVLYG